MGHGRRRPDHRRRGILAPGGQHSGMSETTVKSWRPWLMLHGSRVGKCLTRVRLGPEVLGHWAVQFSMKFFCLLQS